MERKEAEAEHQTGDMGVLIAVGKSGQGVERRAIPEWAGHLNRRRISTLHI